MRKRKAGKRGSRLAPALRPGDPISVVAPSSAFDAARLHEAALWLDTRGHPVMYEKGIFAKDDYLAGDDARRLREFEEAWADPSTRAVLAARGGYGALRIVDRLRVSKLKRSRKIFMGLSDLTVLLNVLAKKLNLVTVHGPMLAGDSFLGLDPELRGRLFDRLETGAAVTLREPIDHRVLFPGHTRGRLWGGNLAMVAATVGTPFEVPCAGGILFLEEVNEPKYRIDRMFAQLAYAGVFARIRGLVLGQFFDTQRVSFDLSWLKGLVDRWAPARKIPVLAGVKAGHGRNEVWLPIGGECEIRDGGRVFELSPLTRKDDRR